MKELLLYIAKNLVGNPDAVRVEEREDGDTTVLELHVAPEDMGRVIGKQGRVAKDIRTVMRSAGMKSGRWVSVDIVG